MYIRRPPQSVERVRLQPNPVFQTPSPSSKASAQAAQEAAQPRMTHACSSPGWMVQDLINYSSYRGHSSLQSRATGLFSAANPRAPHAPFCPPGPSN